VLTILAFTRVIPAVTGGTTFVVGGGSMEPTIPIGAAIVATPVSAADLAVGDVVSLQVGEQRAIFTHRITRLVTREGSLWLETKGDANEGPDPSIVPATSVIGRVSMTLPWAGYLITVLGSLQGILFLVSLGVMVLGRGMAPGRAGGRPGRVAPPTGPGRSRPPGAGALHGAGGDWLTRRGPVAQRIRIEGFEDPLRDPGARSRISALARADASNVLAVAGRASSREVRA